MSIRVHARTDRSRRVLNESRSVELGLADDADARDGAKKGCGKSHGHCNEGEQTGKTSRFTKCGVKAIVPLLSLQIQKCAVDRERIGANVANHIPCRIERNDSSNVVFS